MQCYSYTAQWTAQPRTVALLIPSLPTFRSLHRLPFCTSASYSRNSDILFVDASQYSTSCSPQQVMCQDTSYSQTCDIAACRPDMEIVHMPARPEIEQDSLSEPPSTDGTCLYLAFSLSAPCPPPWFDQTDIQADRTTHATDFDSSARMSKKFSKSLGQSCLTLTQWYSASPKNICRGICMDLLHDMYKHTNQGQVFDLLTNQVARRDGR